MAKLKTDAPKKILLKAVKEKYAEPSESVSSVHENEILKPLDIQAAFSNSMRIKGKRTPHPSGAKLDRCALCNGKLEERTTEFMARASGEVVIINDVPAFVCEQCGEAYFTAETSRRIDAVMREAHQKKLCVRPVPAGEVSLKT